MTDKPFEMDLTVYAATLEEAQDMATCEAVLAEGDSPPPFNERLTEGIPPWSAVSGPPATDDATN